MNNDIRFYDFDLNLLYILPPYGNGIGYKSINAKQEYNNSGSVEISFIDNDLMKLVEQYKDTIIVTWKDFQGFLTSYTFNTEFRLFGMSLNGLLHRIVIPATNGEISGTVQKLSNAALRNVSWLRLGSDKGFENSITYQSEQYLTADAYIQKLLALDSAGYCIKADTINKTFTFELIKPTENELILSENNLNAYDVETSYNNKSIAFGGWYKEKQENDAEGNAIDPIWKYISIDNSKEGIYKIDTILSSETATEALNELKEKKATYETTAKTKEILHNVDYCIGDVIRLQTDKTTVKKLVSGVSMWNENYYGEQPILIESEVI